MKYTRTTHMCKPPTQHNFSRIQKIVNISYQFITDRVSDEAPKTSEGDFLTRISSSA